MGILPFSEVRSVHTEDIKNVICSGKLDGYFRREYGKEASEAQKSRYLKALDTFSSIYGGDREVSVFSVGGRSEISGNHTDHNRGRVVAAAVSLDIIAVASVRDDDTVRIKSEGFPEDAVDLGQYTAPVEESFYTSGAIIAGVADGFRRKGFAAGGLDAYTVSDVKGGSGLSSSAAFEVMVGNMLNHFYNGGRVSAIDIAKIAQYSENRFFGKPCGLMDQTACAVGGFVAIDFEDPENPKVTPLSFELEKAGYSLCIVSPGGSHADLNDEYASIPAEMKSVAGEFGKDVLRGLTEKDIIGKMPELRKKTGDRAVLRALHFIGEDRRAGELAEIISSGDIRRFLKSVSESGNSSFKYLQNVYQTKDAKEEGLALALKASEIFLEGTESACRVHGGGFAGTIQAFVPADTAGKYREYMDELFGKDSCRTLCVRPDGAVRVI
ncbi:MAG: galactokinase [Clostridia bacterium]|nr:galactokinase [Clostridia bacterium]